MTTMRAKMKVTNVNTFYTSGTEETISGQRVSFNAVCKKGGYDSTGSDENNTFAKWTPSADAHFNINNPALFGKFTIGEEYYVDFTKAEQ